MREDIRKLDEAYADIPRDVFICYSSRQKEQAMRAVEALEADGNTCDKQAGRSFLPAFFDLVK